MNFTRCDHQMENCCKYKLKEYFLPHFEINQKSAIVFERYFNGWWVI